MISLIVGILGGLVALALLFVALMFIAALVVTIRDMKRYADQHGVTYHEAAVTLNGQYRERERKRQAEEMRRKYNL